MCCGRQFKAEGYSSVCLGCRTLVIYGCMAGLKKGKWLNKWSQGGGERGSSLAYKTGVRGKGKQDREQRKLRRREDSHGEGTSKTLKPSGMP